MLLMKKRILFLFVVLGVFFSSLPFSFAQALEDHYSQGVDLLADGKFFLASAEFSRHLIGKNADEISGEKRFVIASTFYFTGKNYVADKLVKDLDVAKFVTGSSEKERVKNIFFFYLRSNNKKDLTNLLNGKIKGFDSKSAAFELKILKGTSAKILV